LFLLEGVEWAKAVALALAVKRFFLKRVAVAIFGALQTTLAELTLAKANRAAVALRLSLLVILVLLLSGYRLLVALLLFKFESHFVGHNGFNLM
jgi:hypothetical protein